MKHIARRKVAVRPSTAVPAALASDTLGGAFAPLNGFRWVTIPRDANADTLRPLPLQRAQSRDLARHNPVVVGAMGTYLDRVVGTGLALVAAPDRRVLGWSDERAEAWKHLVQTEFSLWADNADCDITAAGNFYQRQRVVAGARAESGDCFSLLPDGEQTPTMPYRLRLQLLEADRIGNPGGLSDTADTAGGIQRDPNGRPLRYFVYHRHPGSSYATSDRFAGQWVDAIGPSGRRRMLHHWQPTRPEQSRGVPWFAPIVALLKDLHAYTDAELKAALVSSFFTTFVLTETGDPAPIFAGATLDEGRADPSEIRMGPGAVVGLARNEKVEFADPSRPNTAFEAFVNAVTVQIGMALSIPFELLTKRFNASYSASRAALLDAWMFFRTQRAWLALSFCQPSYETWLAEAVSMNRVAAPGFFSDPLLRWAYTRAAWHGDSQGSINPKDEVAAYAAALDAGLMTHERAEWELFGSDWNVTLAQKVAEHRRLAAEGLLPPPKPGAAAGPGEPSSPVSSPAPATDTEVQP